MFRNSCLFRPAASKLPDIPASPCANLKPTGEPITATIHIRIAASMTPALGARCPKPARRGRGGVWLEFEPVLALAAVEPQLSQLLRAATTMYSSKLSRTASLQPVLKTATQGACSGRYHNVKILNYVMNSRKTNDFQSWIISEFCSVF